MGNLFSNCSSKSKSKKKKSEKQSKGSKTRENANFAQDDPHTYDMVAPDVPIYAVVNKKKPSDLHYAEVHMVRQRSQRSAKQVKRSQKANATEYATINFPPPVNYDRKNGTLV
uniref:Uncharacterized protein n=1 Tax=Callorhinchus milii TaxID=7868 RepID=V9LBQ0_CALMI|eukprot:gi/632985661/ref/XP_007909808.1/ PREDICTED: uncharacterized protein C11orf52 homolog [Callorhinchus milii]